MHIEIEICWNTCLKTVHVQAVGGDVCAPFSVVPGSRLLFISYGRRAANVVVVDVWF